MIKYFFFFIISTKLFAEPCNVEFYSKIYKNENSQILTSKDIIKNSSCAEELNNKITALISKKDGDIFVSNIEKEFGNENLHITPRKLMIQSLQNIFREQLTANSNLYFFDIKTIGGPKTLALNEEETIRSICESCQNHGDKNVKLEISSALNGTTKAFWYNTKLFAKVKVIKAKNTLGFQQKSLSKDDFFTDETFTMMPDNLLGSLENIQFFRPNRTIVSGSIITNMDITPINLVNYGVPVKATLKNAVINLTKIATPMRNAQYGETVELKVGSNKTISGKVIDFNQVVIEL